MKVAFSVGNLSALERELDGLAERLTSKQALEAMGAGMRSLVSDHLVALNAKPNKNNWPKTNFYAEAAESLYTQTAGDNAVEVVIPKTGMAQRFYGGAIYPVNVSALTIPMNALAYGKSAREFPGLVFLPIRTGNPMTIGILFLAVNGGRGRMKAIADKERKASARLAKLTPPKKTMIAMYLLSRGVWQQGDKNVLPTMESIADAAFQGLAEAVNAARAGAGAGANEV